MKKSPFSLLPFIFIVLSCGSDAQQADPRYFNQSTPGLTPAVFAPDSISREDQFEFGAVFSRKRDEFYYAVEIEGKTETRMRIFRNGAWQPPTTILVHNVYSFNDPFLTPDETKLFFISNRPLTGEGPRKDYDIWYIERKDGKWSEPTNAGQNINSSKNEYYISFTDSGKMYFSSNTGDRSEGNDFDIYSSEFRSGNFEPAVKLPSAINSIHYEADVFVAPDESYLAFAANRPGGSGAGDLYVSFHDGNGNWTESQSLGNTINTETDDFCPYVSPDGKYLFYASRRDIYWVSSDVIAKLRPK